MEKIQQQFKRDHTDQTWDILDIKINNKKWIIS